MSLATLSLGHGGPRIAKGIHLQAQQVQPIADCLQCLGQVVDHQCTTSRQLQRGAIAVCQGLRRHDAQARGEPEAAARAGLALHAHVATHQARQVARQGQAQARAAVAARGRRVGLLEGVEQARQRVGGDAFAGVADLEAHQGRLAIALQRLDAQAHPAVVGELHRIAQQIDQGLRQPRGIAMQVVGRMVGIHHQLQALLACLRAHQVDHPDHHVVEREGLLLQHHLAGFDLGQVQDVVDDLQQVLRRALDLAQALALLGVAGFARHQVGQPDDGVHRRADLVAHVGQEGALGEGGRFGAGLGPLQGRLGRLACRDVGDKADEAGGRLGRGLLEVDQHLDRQHPAVLGPVDRLEARRSLHAQLVGHFVARGLRPVRVDVGDAQRQHLVDGVAQHPRRALARKNSASAPR